MLGFLVLVAARTCITATLLMLKATQCYSHLILLSYTFSKFFSIVAWISGRCQRQAKQSKAKQGQSKGKRKAKSKQKQSKGKQSKELQENSKAKKDNVKGNAKGNAKGIAKSNEMVQELNIDIK
jgi:uncharacterized protein HemX